MSLPRPPLALAAVAALASRSPNSIPALPSAPFPPLSHSNHRALEVGHGGFGSWLLPLVDADGGCGNRLGLDLCGLPDESMR